MQRKNCIKCKKIKVQNRLENANNLFSYRADTFPSLYQLPEFATFILLQRDLACSENTMQEQTQASVSSHPILFNQSISCHLKAISKKGQQCV